MVLPKHESMYVLGRVLAQEDDLLEYGLGLLLIMRLEHTEMRKGLPETKRHRIVALNQYHDTSAYVSPIEHYVTEFLFGRLLLKVGRHVIYHEQRVLPGLLVDPLIGEMLYLVQDTPV